MIDDGAEIAAELDLETWLENEGVTFKSAHGHSGRQLIIKECPECSKRNWKVYLNAETGIGNCFSCDARFNKLKFIHDQLGLSWRETFEHARKALKEQGWRPKRTTTAAVEQEKATFPNSFELPTPEGQNLLYLEQRGITPELAKFFHLRFCENGWWNYIKDDGSKGGQKFDGRVIIPVYDLDGEFVTFQGRDILGDTDDAYYRKYLFPQSLPGTGRFIFNGQNAVGAKRICMGEGAFDVFAQKIAFDEEVALRGIVPVGSFGKNLSFGDMTGNDQLGRLLKLKAHGLEEVTIMWDGERSAVIAALDAAKRIKRLGLRARVALLPPGKDPNEVPGAVVREAFWKAPAYTTQLEIQWRIRNPYA